MFESVGVMEFGHEFSLPWAKYFAMPSESIGLAMSCKPRRCLNDQGRFRAAHMCRYGRLILELSSLPGAGHVTSRCQRNLDRSLDATLNPGALPLRSDLAQQVGHCRLGDRE